MAISLMEKAKMVAVLIFKPYLISTRNKFWIAFLPQKPIHQRKIKITKELPKQKTKQKKQIKKKQKQKKLSRRECVSVYVCVYIYS